MCGVPWGGRKTTFQHHRVMNEKQSFSAKLIIFSDYLLNSGQFCTIPNYKALHLKWFPFKISKIWFLLWKLHMKTDKTKIYMKNLILIQIKHKIFLFVLTNLYKKDKNIFVKLIFFYIPLWLFDSIILLSLFRYLTTSKKFT